MQRNRVSISFKGDSKYVKSRTKQAFKKECDINTILKKYKNQGVSIPLGMDPNATFGDFSDIGDYQTMIARLDDAHRMFMTMPAELRYKFGNDVSNLLEFIADDKNIPEAQELGILPKPKVEDSGNGAPEGAQPPTGGVPAEAGA